ncbi:cytochrome P450 [Clohesyomyces aquaticus]|uniref:Cytochrome P450 n=1 Tax=Clohesyomyces aquaticus TaxID=1231657 RepID=A0A1Y1XW09_9PLEO|nr:cytochrome P450 [Clohesyomyces aquaticus]
MDIRWSLLALAAAWGVTYCGWKLYQHRARINKLREQGMPMPAGWSWIFGHILLLRQITQSELPPYANVNNVFPKLAADFADQEMFLLDIWPVGHSMVIVFNPDTAFDISQKRNLPKVKNMDGMLRPITGGANLLSQNHEEWRIWRSLFNPGFSHGVISEHIPGIVDIVDVFCTSLKSSVGQGIVFLDDLTSRLTFDIIMKVVLDTDAKHQQSDHILAQALGVITRWHSFWDPRVLMNPLRPFIQHQYSSIIKRYIRSELNARFDEVNSPSSLATKSHSKSAISLAIQAYNSSTPQRDIPVLETSFAEMATNQIRLFLFAGNDTTSSSIVFTYHLLSQNPAVLHELRREHDTIFSPDPSAAANLIKQHPALIHQCPYTLAVIKETLRLFPPASTMRDGEGAHVTTRNGLTLPTDGLAIIVSHVTMQRNPRLWPRPEAFLPERWLVGLEHDLYPPKNAYRPFELGPRNCIGQTLTLTEMKLVLILTARTFDIQPAYQEFDEEGNRNRGWIERGMTSLGFKHEQLKTLNGDRAFQTEKAGAHPSDGYPCRITFRS